MVAPMSVSPVLASVTVPLMVCWAQSVLHKRQKANGRRSLFFIRDEHIIMSFFFSGIELHKVFGSYLCSGIFVPLGGMRSGVVIGRRRIGLMVCVDLFMGVVI